MIKIKRFNNTLIVVAWLISSCALAQESTTDSSSNKNESPFKLYTVLVEAFYTTTKHEGAKWQSAFDLLEYERVLVLGELKQDEDFVRHADILDLYIKATSDYLNFLENLYENTEKKFLIYGLSDDQVKPVIDNLLSTYKVQKNTLIELLNVHLKYGDQMQSFLTFLTENKAEWQLNKGEVVMEDKSLAKDYNSYIDQLVILEDQIELLSKQLNFQLK